MAYLDVPAGKAVLRLSNCTDSPHPDRTMFVQYDEKLMGSFALDVPARAEVWIKHAQSEAKKHGCALEIIDERAKRKLTEWMGE